MQTDPGTSRGSSSVQLIGTEISGALFGVSSSDEVRANSVKVIVNPVLLDSLNHATKGGLYDPSLGPPDRTALCATCSLPYHQCPGHWAHIELAVPIYNPMFFSHTMLILKSLCFVCHQFRIAQHKTFKYISMLRLMDEGLLFDAMNLHTMFPLPEKKSKKRGEPKEGEKEEEEGEEERVTPEQYTENIEKFVQDALQRKKNGTHDSQKFTEKAPHLQDYRRKIISEYFKKPPTSKCENCRGHSPTLSRDGVIKIFQNPYSKKTKAIMEATGQSERVLFPESQNAKSKSAEEGEQQADDVREMELDIPTTDANKPAKEDKKKFLLPVHVREHFKLLWQKESGIVNQIFGCYKLERGKLTTTRESDYNQFFLEVIPVSPTRYRPPSKLGDQIFENPQNLHLTNILNANIRILEFYGNKTDKDGLPIDNDLKLENIVKSWIQLQEEVNMLYDNSSAPMLKGKTPPQGIKQILEKKEGLFRKHMMGKRVNFGARSVISPDPFIETSEIGIPMVFAKKLTYPEPVTAYNVKELRQAVINGPEKHPGATHIQHEDGNLSALSNFTLEGRIALSNQLLTPQSGSDITKVNKKVLRHIRNGDVLLVNRQPTLHKPSIMAHTARILTGEKTLRLHYANCNSYNADFDGDEMNLHFPQNEIARAEAYGIAITNEQYLVPTDGSPLRGLIQDHVDAGVIMSMRGTFFDREMYQQLIFGSLPDTMYIETLPPCIIKPKKLWSGKQIISTVLLNLTKGKPTMNLRGKAKTPAKAWPGKGCEESEVIFEQSELLMGVLDKNAFGASKYGLVHSCYELYGAETAGKVLTTLGKLFTKYIQMIGFSCRIDDLILTEQGDENRREILQRSNNIGGEVTASFVGLANTTANQDGIITKLRKIVREDKELAKLDNAMKSKANELTSSVLDKCLPYGLYKQFPLNNMSLMTQAGAKGSNVNMSQISCLLGQQELEGRRVPVMVSGKTLPSFRAYDTSARAGGYITQRFLTGIKPQEYYFHCMAGREGLVDTAVKTSRAGYLQRCIIKHLEGLKVAYDYTVRNYDSSLIQFSYGEDCLDVSKSSYLNQFDFAARNYHVLLRKYNPRAALAVIDQEKASELLHKAKEDPENNEPVLTLLNPSTHLGSVSENFYDALEKYIEKNPAGLILQDDDKRKYGKVEESKFHALMLLKYLHSLVEPGEAVGILAGQSIGEPSTQMTLNTFHLAGFGAKNVTLGIPRLREIMMTGSAAIKTPFMELPLLPSATKKDALRICQALSRLPLSALLEKVVVKNSIETLTGSRSRNRVYNVTLHFIPLEDLKRKHKVSQESLSSVIEFSFIKKLLSHINRKLKLNKSGEQIGVGTAVNFGESNLNTDVDEDIPVSNDLDKEDDEGDDDATSAKEAQNKKQSASYDDDDGDEKVEEEKEENEDQEDDEDTEEPQNKNEKEKEKTKSSTQARARYENVDKFKFDMEKNTCSFSISYPINLTKLLMVSEIEKVSTFTILREVKGITRCFIEDQDNAEEKNIQLATEGVNIPGVWQYADVIDVNKITSNNIRSILEIYGVEAARATIVQEVAKVFGVYGISVDPRHLFLIADYMTYEGGYKAFNRMSMESATSPFQKMSFETTIAFLRGACLTGDYELLKSPSSRLVIGKPVLGGTGSFDILQPLK